MYRAVRTALLLTWFALFAALLLMSTGCAAQQQQPGANKVVFVGVDISGSTLNDRERYRDALETVLEQLNPGDALVVERICENSAGSSTLPINADFSKFVSSDDTFGAAHKNLQHRFKSEKQRIMGEVDALLQQQSTQTDILGVVEVGAQSLANYSQPRKILVLLSDMMHQAGDYNFMAMRFNRETIERLIRTEKSEGLPNLQDVTVYVVAPTDEDRRRIKSVRAFWFRYFEETGASLQPEHYGSSIVRFDE